jgi:hypothetical protein
MKVISSGDGWERVRYADEEWQRIAPFLFHGNLSDFPDYDAFLRSEREFILYCYWEGLLCKKAGSQQHQLRLLDNLDRAIETVLLNLREDLRLHVDMSSRAETPIAIRVLERFREYHQGTRRFVADNVPKDFRQTPEVADFIRAALSFYADCHHLRHENEYSIPSVGSKESPNSVMRFLAAAAEPVIGKRHPESLWRLANTALRRLRDHSGQQ